MGLWCIDCEATGKNNFDTNTTTCKRCGSSNVVNLPREMTIGDILTLTKISKDKKFFEAMSNLYETNIIEYQLKMSQFKQQVEQQESINLKNNNTPKCPTCGSTNIEKISLGKKALGGAMFGLFSSNVRNSMHCKNCGAKW